MGRLEEEGSETERVGGGEKTEMMIMICIGKGGDEKGMKKEREEEDGKCKL